MRSEHIAIILGKLALLEYRDLKTALKQKKCCKKTAQDYYLLSHCDSSVWVLRHVASPLQSAYLKLTRPERVLPVKLIGLSPVGLGVM